MLGHIAFNGSTTFIEDEHLMKIIYNAKLEVVEIHFFHDMVNFILC